MPSNVTTYGCGCQFFRAESAVLGAGPAPDHCPCHGKKVAAFVRPDPAMTPRCFTCKLWPLVTLAFNNPTPAPHCTGCMQLEKDCTCLPKP